ncbi:hypothetical protein [Fischerella sp. PCC 9605]|uniref:hypothetical protein n=1 Tax=Fischerella sp. PCC 9605 TaxID=1173024 RepID=UPI0012DD991F|nr:hypothetical protein [Fischerella sp. PCC 9605]
MSGQGRRELRSPCLGEWYIRLHSLAVDVRSEDAKVSDDGVRRAIALLTRRGVYAFTLWRWMCAQRMQRFLMNE